MDPQLSRKWRTWQFQTLLLLVGWLLIETARSAPTALEFSRACNPGRQILINAVGDVLLHQPLQVQGYASHDGFHSLWKAASPILEDANVTYANMEGPVAGPINSSKKIVKPDPGKHFDNEAYTGYPLFNYHPSILADLFSLGVDVISTANNHAMDRGSIGADLTLKNARGAGLKTTGTRSTEDPNAPWYTITNEGGVTLAWIACTYDTNGIDDPKHQVLLCFHDTAVLLKTVSDLANTPGINGVVVTPHWGDEYSNSPKLSQKNLAKSLLEAGATAVIGSHPHVLQPWEKIKLSSGREGFVFYSLGNFVSNQRELPKRSSVILHLGITVDSQTQKAFVNGAQITPIAMDFDESPYSLRLASPKTKKDTYDHVVGLFGAENLSLGQLKQGKTRIVPNPQCQ